MYKTNKELLFYKLFEILLECKLFQIFIEILNTYGNKNLPCRQIN